MRIKKTYQGSLPENKIVNTQSESQTDTYSCNYMNENFYSVGSVYITSTNTNPSAKLGGTWELIDKAFKELKGSDTGSGTYFTKDETNVGNYTLYFVRHDSNIQLRLMFRNNVELSDDAITLGTLLFDKLGFSKLYFALYSHLGATDGGNAVIQSTLTYNTGVITATDVINKTSGANVAINSELYIEYNLTIPLEYMLDSACDKFYWKRTA